jgi:dihydrolipoamide dehydrogenase
VTDPWCRTNIAGVYAIGDVAGAPCLAHKASHEGVICVEKLAGVEDVHPLDKTRVPGCTYCRPQVASVGMTETRARAMGRTVNVGRFNLQANGKALASGEAAGFVKSIFDAQSGELLGAHMVGPEVTEQIQGFGLAQALEATDADLAHTVFPHPTLSEAMHEAVLDALGRALHQ